jgi:hypothetical protein
VYLLWSASRRSWGQGDPCEGEEDRVDEGYIGATMAKGQALRGPHGRPTWQIRRPAMRPSELAHGVALLLPR